jgi:hypothetical protein
MIAASASASGIPTSSSISRVALVVCWSRSAAVCLGLLDGHVLSTIDAAIPLGPPGVAVVGLASAP